MLPGPWSQPALSPTRLHFQIVGQFRPNETKTSRCSAQRHDLHSKPARRNWFKEGQRVARKDTGEVGTIVEAGRNQIKVKWEGGKTSYFKRGQVGNFRSVGSTAKIGRADSVWIMRRKS
jgi:hypothetical protein